MKGVISDSGKTIKQQAQKIAKQLAQEPFEMAKSAKSQVSPFEIVQGQGQPKTTNRSNQTRTPSDTQRQENADKIQSQRLIQAYEQELKDISKKSLYEELLEMTGQGIYVPVEDYPQLSPEERQVLKASTRQLWHECSKQQGMGG